MTPFVNSVSKMFDLQPHGPDTFVGSGPQYPWGGLYGGQIVAQALRAATLSVDDAYVPHSIRAYFIRPGDHTEPVRYEVDRIRNGRSFSTRRVVARQAIGAILNAECSFQRPTESRVVQTIRAPKISSWSEFDNVSFSDTFEARLVSPTDQPAERDGAGRVIAWMRVVDDFVPSATSPADLAVLHQSWLAYLSDHLATDTIKATMHEADPEWALDDMLSISLDHTVWFHCPMRVDEWHIHDFSCHHVGGGRGVSIGHVFSADGEHVASVAQEALLRDLRKAPDAPG